MTCLAAIFTVLTSILILVALYMLIWLVSAFTLPVPL